MSPRKDTNKVDNPTFKKLTVEVYSKVLSKLIEVYTTLLRRTENVVRVRVLYY